MSVLDHLGVDHARPEFKAGDPSSLRSSPCASCTSVRLTPYRLHKGELTRLSPITLPYPVMNHDFVMTANHLVFCLGPILVHPLRLLLRLASFDGALQWDGGRPTLILLLRRDGTGSPRWIETEPFFQFHFANGFEADDTLVLDLTRYPDYAAIGDRLRDYWHSEWAADGMASLARLRVDLTTAKVTSHCFEVGNANEFPRINPQRSGSSYHYAYIAIRPASSAGCNDA